MKKIYHLRIKNFKAFQDEELFEFNGKNILIYGNNGAGKSSLFWALYTFLQSSIKPSNEEIQKYFDSSSHQNLLNIFMDDGEESNIEMTYKDEDTQETTTNIISKEIINTRNDSTIQELNLASDFLNYKLLHNFYNASHKDEVNLWAVFEKDIFPFYADGTIAILNKIKNKTQPISGNKTQPAKTRKQTDLDEINIELETLLNDITNIANDFLKKHFYNNRDVIKINLLFSKKFTLQNINKSLWAEGNDPIRHSELHIKLIVEQYIGHDEWKPLHRVQSFLNEAQLTRIAIAIRMGALRSRVQGTDFKILVIDDMLNSLDMSNRVDVMRIILNTENNQDLNYFDNFQKIILTHDKGFYNLLKRQTDDSDWMYYKFDKDENQNNHPIITKGLTKIQEAQHLLDIGEFEACGIKLRKEAEDILSDFLNPSMKIVDSEFKSLSKKIKSAYESIVGSELQNIKRLLSNKVLTLDEIKKIELDIDSIPDNELSVAKKGQLKTIKKRLFKMLIELYSVSHTKEKHLDELKEILDRVLNSTAHHNDNNLYRNELRTAIQHMVSLKAELESN